MLDGSPLVDGHILSVRIERGVNTLLLRLTGNNENFLRVTNSEGVALADIKYSVPDLSANRFNTEFLPKER